MTEMYAEIAVAVIGLIGICITAWVGRQKQIKQKVRADQAESEMRFQRAALDFGGFMAEWGETHSEIEKLLKETEIDRFLILRAWNGHLNPKWTTAVFQMRIGDQEPISYVHFELDADYVSKLKDISINNTIHFSTSGIPDSAIKRVYEAEGVKYAVWCHISTDKTPSGAAVHTYCSFATKDNPSVAQSTITRCSILAGRLKGVAMAFQGDA